MENTEQNKLSGFLGTFIFHGIILLWLLFAYFSTSIIPKTEGVLVAFGNIDEAGGFFEPGPGNIEASLPGLPEPVIPSQPEPALKPKPKPDTKQERIITQESARTTYIENSAQKEAEKRKEAEARLQQEKQRQQQAEADKKRKEQEAIAAQINNLGVGAFKSETGQGAGSGQGTGSGTGMRDGTGTGTGQGTGTGSGIQGNPFGNSTQGSSTGVGGLGSYALQGRTLGADGLPRPTASAKEEGRIVVNITVDSKGNVIFAEIGSGTNIANQTLRKSAVEAAKKAKFNSINTTNNQTGTITYKYSY